MPSPTAHISIYTTLKLVSIIQVNAIILWCLKMCNSLTFLIILHVIYFAVCVIQYCSLFTMCSLSVWSWAGGALGPVLAASFPVAILSPGQCNYWAQTQTLQRPTAASKARQQKHMVAVAREGDG